jgi:hypothetical protein
VTQFSSGVLEIEFTAGVWTDVSAFYRLPVSLRFGRATQFDDVGAGVLKVRLDNFDGRFMPDWFGSPYYPNVVKNKRVRWKVTKAGVTYTRHRGWIQAWEPHFPDGSTNSAYVDITSVDALGLLAQKKLHSSAAELALYAGRRDGTTIDAYEAYGLVSGMFLFCTNISNDATAGQGFAVGVLRAPALSFGSDRVITSGPTIEVTTNSLDNSCTTRLSIQATPINIQFMFKSPNSHVSNVGANYTFFTAENAAGTTKQFNISFHDDSAGNNEIRVCDANNTALLATIGQIANGRWYMLALTQNAGTATSTDFQAWDETGAAVGAPGPTVAVDIRNVRNIELPGVQGSTMPMSFGGLIATRTRTQIPWQFWFAAGSTSLAQRMTDLANVCNLMPISFTQVGDWSALSCTGPDWYGRYALDVAGEIVRSTRNVATGTGIMFARPRDSQVLAIAGSVTRPATPIATVGADADLLAGLDLASAVDTLPTRVVVQSPQVNVVSKDSAAIAAGEDRSVTINTISLGGVSDAQDIADLYLNRNKNLRFGKVRIDLTGATNDPTAALFDESGTNTGLYPTGKVRIAELPATHFTYPTRDVFVEGWDEIYDINGAYIVADTSPAQTQTRASEFFTGTNGSAWPGQWVAGSGSGTFQIQGNRGRITPAASSQSYQSKRINVAAATDGELSGSMILNDVNASGIVWIRGDTGLTSDGYRLRMDCSGTLTMHRLVASSVTTIGTFTKALSAATQYGWRIRMCGKYLNARVWTWGFNEQSTWDFALIDTVVTAAGYAGLAAQNDSSATPRTVDFDDIVYTDAAGI